MVRKVRPGTALASSALTDLAENSAHPQAAAPRWSLAASDPAGGHRARVRTAAQSAPAR